MINSCMQFSRQTTPIQHQADTNGQNAGSIPERNELSPDYQWQLTDLYPDEAVWQQDVIQAKNIIEQIVKLAPTFAQSSHSLLQCLQLRDQLGIIGGKLYAYARLHRDENSANQKYQAMTGNIETMLANASASTSFIEPEIIALPDKVLPNYLQENPSLEIYRFYFENLLRQKKHVLSPAEEKLISLSANATQASENIFNMLAHADLEFPFIQDEQGQNIQLSEGRYQILIKSPDRAVRKQAFENLFSTYAKYRNTFAATLGGNTKADNFYAVIRNYPSTLEASLESDNVPNAVYNNLIQTAHDNLTPLHKYVTLKKKTLGLDEMHMYDLYVPLISEVKLDVKYAEAIDLIKAGLAPLGEDYIKILHEGFSSHWIDVYENKGKQTGAYSFGTYGAHPFVLMNYNDRYEAASTLAHEMGHAIHSYLSQASQPYVNSNYTIFCAEVASTTNEILLLDHMLDITQDKNIKKFLINQYLEGVRTTIYRQTMFAEFERNIHNEVQNGETLTADGLSSLWHELNVKYYGPDIVVDSNIDMEWARIPHFYSSFYVYQYVTGYSAATALAEQIQQQGLPAQKRYIEFLQSGGSDYSINLLKKAGVDMTSPRPIEITLNKFADRLAELEQLL